MADKDFKAQGDNIDAKKFSRISNNAKVEHGILSIAIDSDEYKMDYPHRGKCIIFNHKEFEPHTNCSVRRGTEEDATSLYHCFRNLDFDVTVHHNLKVNAILSILENVSKEDHSQSDCFVCCILTHGDEGILYGRDGRYVTDQVFAPFRGDVCTSLAGKPKIFFIQACQGDRLDKGVTLKVERYDSAQLCKIPTHADFLIVYSTVPGFYSWRNTTRGSWFIQALCETLNQYSKKSESLEMMTVVCRKVAYEYESNTPDDLDMHMMKQVPCVTSTLTRKIFFSSKFM